MAGAGAGAGGALPVGLVPLPPGLGFVGLYPGQKCRAWQVLTPEQEARCLVGSYPYHPDVLAYSTAVARELGDPSAHAPVLHPDALLELPYGARLNARTARVQLQSGPPSKLGTSSDMVKRWETRDAFPGCCPGEIPALEACRSSACFHTVYVLEALYAPYGTCHGMRMQGKAWQLLDPLVNRLVPQSSTWSAEAGCVSQGPGRKRACRLPATPCRWRRRQATPASRLAWRCLRAAPSAQAVTDRGPGDASRTL